MAKEIPPNKFPTKEEALQGLENPMVKALEDHGITLDYLSDKLQKELEAGEQRAFNAKGTIIYSNTQEAWKTRQEARKDAHKLRGDYPAEKKEISGPGGTPLIPPSDPKEKELLKKLADKLIEEEKRKIREE